MQIAAFPHQFGIDEWTQKVPVPVIRNDNHFYYAASHNHYYGAASYAPYCGDYATKPSG